MVAVFMVLKREFRLRCRGSGWSARGSGEYRRGYARVWALRKRQTRDDAAAHGVKFAEADDAVFIGRITFTVLHLTMKTRECIACRVASRINAKLAERDGAK